jgi:hypothetical protein
MSTTRQSGVGNCSISTIAFDRKMYGNDYDQRREEQDHDHFRIVSARGEEGQANREAADDAHRVKDREPISVSV